MPTENYHMPPLLFPISTSSTQHAIPQFLYFPTRRHRDSIICSASISRLHLISIDGSFNAHAHTTLKNYWNIGFKLSNSTSMPIVLSPLRLDGRWILMPLLLMIPTHSDDLPMICCNAKNLPAWRMTSSVHACALELIFMHDEWYDAVSASDIRTPSENASLAIHTKTARYFDFDQKKIIPGTITKLYLPHIYIHSFTKTCFTLYWCAARR
jgi:hypothetical protein